MKPLFSLNRYFIKYKWWILPGLLFVISSNLFGVMPAQIIGHAYNLIVDNISLYRLYDGFERQQLIYDIFSYNLMLFAALILVMYLMRGVFLFLMRQTIILMSRHIEFDMKNEIYAHYQRLSLGFYRRNNTGDLMSRATEDVNRVRMYVGPAIMYAANTFTLFGLVIYYMFSVNVELSFYALLPLPILVITIYYVNTLINKKSEGIQAQLSTLSAFVQERMSGIRVIKAYVQEKFVQQVFAAESNRYKERTMDLVKVQSFFYPAMLLLIGLSTILTIYIGGDKVIDGSITAGNIAEFIVYVNQLSFPVSMLGWVTTLVQRASASQKRINEFLHLQPEIQSGDVVFEQLEHEIVFDKVSFTYTETGIRALHNISLKIKKGQFVAIVGKTGSGKSTLANLLLRMYDIDEGEIRVDGVPIKKLDLPSYRSKMAFVPQELFLFSDSIKNNIGFGMDSVDEQAVIQAAKDAAVYQNIVEFEKGFDTLLGERGITLSGGQKQRVSIARALIKSPQVLVFDDSLSAVDTKTEEEIMQNLGRIMADKTTLIIAHRISTIQHADLIVVLDDGQIIEQGNHQELLSLKGAYAEIYNKQLLETEQSSAN